MSNVATRLLSLIMMLQSKSPWKASELAGELNVSERTVHRYMAMLDEMGIPIYSERGPYGGFSLVRGYKLPPLIFSPEEATVLYMGANLIEDVWGDTYADAVTSVTAKLDNVLPDDLRQEVARAERSLIVGINAARDYEHWQDTIHMLRDCIAKQVCVRLVYHGLARQEDTCRIVEPYALAFQWGLWYLAGFCQLRNDMRTFRVDRIQEAAPTEDPFTLPEAFCAEAYFARTMNSQNAYRVVVRMAASIAQDVKEWNRHWLEITDRPDGSIDVAFDTANLDWAAGWVLNHGAAARVLEPPELVKQVQTRAREVLATYEDTR